MSLGRRRWVRRIVLALVAAVLLWIGLGQPIRTRPHHRARWIEVDGVRTRALMAGRGDTTLVFLHGYGESLLSWRTLLDRFTRDYRVLALDLPGFGLSRSDAGFQYDYPSYARWLEAVVSRYTHGPLIVVGHSMGGQLAAGLAIDHPESVVAAVLIAPAGAGINPLFADTASVASSAARWVASAFSFVFPQHDSTWLDESDLEPVPVEGSDSALATGEMVIAHFDFAALEHRFSDLKQPVLLIWGRQDPTIPLAIGDRIAAVLPCRRFVQLFTLHRPHQMVPDTVAAEMGRFFRQGGCGG